MQCVGFNNQAEAALKRAVYAVEATAYERLCLGIKYGPRGLNSVGQDGGMKTIGSVMVEGKEMPVTVEVWFGQYKNHTILFYWGSSQVVDHGQIKTWLDSHGFTGPDKRTDAMTFIDALHHIDRLIKQKV